MNIFNLFRRQPRCSTQVHIDRAERICRDMAKDGLLLKDLPFVPDEKEVYYVSDGSNAEADRFVEEHLDLIREQIEDGDWMTFVYLPTIGETLVGDAERWRRTFPDLPLPASPLPSLTNDYLLQFRANTPPEAAPVPPGFVRCCRKRVQKLSGYGCLIFSFYPLDLKLALEETDDYLRALHYALLFHPFRKGPMFSLKSFDPSDPKYDEMAAAALREARESVAQLRRMGISEVVLKRALFPDPKLSPLVITADHRILLPDFGNMEIEMEPLDKAVYFLFLRHPDGIIFKYIEDYREELAQLYDHIRGHRPLHIRLLGMRKYSRSIQRLTDPTSNALNEKVSHIASAFYEKLASELADFYKVSGSRGLPKFIKLPPEMIKWEE